MKALIATIVILVLFFILAIFININIDENTKIIMDRIDRIDKALHNKDWNSVLNNMDLLKEEWERTKNLWVLFLHHTEIDEMERALAKMEKHVEIRESIPVFENIADFRFLVNHISVKKEFRLGNIL